MVKTSRLLLLLLATTSMLNATHEQYETCDASTYGRGSFVKFLSWSNQKEQTSKIILDLVKSKKESFLDIGAGIGDTTKLLGDNFEHVCAIEPSNTFFHILQETLNPEKSILINKTFEKAKFTKKFDLILASHMFQYLSNPTESINRIKKILKTNGLFLLINNNKNCEYTKFYDRYKENIVGKENTVGPTAYNYDFSELLQKTFNVETINFFVTVTMPSVDEVVGIFDFLYDINFNKIKPEALEQAKTDLAETYQTWPLIFKFEYTMYVCRKS